MKVKINKDALLKHRFWILVGTTAVLTLAGTFYLQLYGSEEVDKFRKKLKSEITAAKTTKPEHNPDTIEYWQKKAEKARQSQSKVWSEAYKDQEASFTWAPRVEADFEFLKGKFAHEIKISKLIDEKSWPEDKDFLIHGKFIELHENFFKIKTRKGEEKVFRMENLKIADADNSNKAVSWGIELRLHLNKLMAVNFQTGKHFGDNLLQAEQDIFAETYLDQVHDILKTVDPLDEKGNGVVQLRNWLYRNDRLPDEQAKFIRYMPLKWDLTSKFSKEAWIAQENIWIQKEIYQIIKRANDDISKFKGQGGEEKDAKYVFKNASFSVELILSQNSSLSFNVKNLLQRRQKLDLNFRVRMSKQGAPSIIRISGPPLEPGANQVHTIKYDKDKEFQRTGIYAVEQLLTWETAAVKRIDQISIGSVASGDIAISQRNFSEPLHPLDESLVKEKEKDQNKGEYNMPGKDGGAGKGGGGGNKTLLRHGLWTDRYVVTVSEQSRRVPVAVALIVDQDHIDRVLTHFNNSKLRFLESQVLLNHYSGSLSPPAGAETPKDTGKVNPGFKALGDAEGPVEKGPVAIPRSGGGQDLESNMEMVVYGIMTLYQRYPPRPQMEKRPQ